MHLGTTHVCATCLLLPERLILRDRLLRLRHLADTLRDRKVGVVVQHRPCRIVAGVDAVRTECILPCDIRTFDECLRAAEVLIDRIHPCAIDIRPDCQPTVGQALQVQQTNGEPLVVIE